MREKNSLPLRSKTRRHKPLLTLAWVVGLVLLARSSFADHYVVPSGSMRPTVEIGDRIVVNKLAYGLRLPLSQIWIQGPATPARGDVVVLNSPGDGIVLLKRVVAVAGDRVAVRGGQLELNGRAVPIVISARGQLEEMLEARHALLLEGGGGPDFGPTIVPPGRVLVLGDNRGNSLDGRSFGFVDCEAILGRALAVYLREGAPGWRQL